MISLPSNKVYRQYKYTQKLINSQTTLNFSEFIHASKNKQRLKKSKKKPIKILNILKINIIVVTDEIVISAKIYLLSKPIIISIFKSILKKWRIIKVINDDAIKIIDSRKQM